jgi:hypothetical protein
MKKFIFLVVFLAGNVNARPVGFEGINEATLNVTPSIYEDTVRKIIPSHIKLTNNSRNTIFLAINANKGGILNGRLTAFGSVIFSVFRDADVHIEKLADGKIKKTTARVAVWYDVETIYFDAGAAPVAEAPEAIKELINRSGL